MQRIFLIVAIIIDLINTANSQNFDILTSQIFFNIETKNHDTSVLSDFKKRPDLSLEKKPGWTSYPPTDKKGNTIPSCTFSFSNHPYFPSDFSNGRLMLMVADSNRIIGMTLSLYFNSAKTFDSTYKNIKNLYGKYSSKITERPNVQKPFEVTKYLSKDGKDFVILITGTSENKPYIQVAYNFQDYDW